MRYDVAIIGGGIVGLATGLSLVRRHPRVKIVILEKEPELASHQTGNNSGVIHSGVYYKPGSAKAQYCVSGRRQLIEFCEEQGIPFEICGKVVVATSETEIPALDQIFQRGTENGLRGLRWLSAVELQAVEPHVRGVRAIAVPETGIVDYVSVARKYAELISLQGGDVRTGAKLTGVRRHPTGLTLLTSSGDVEAGYAINCAGLHSDRVALSCGDRPVARIIGFRGEYYQLRPASTHLIRNLVYPVPDPAFPFLGVHFTRMIQGGVECGPNAVLAFKREGYTRLAISARDMAENLAFAGFWRLVGRHWRKGLGEMHRSVSKGAFVRGLQVLVPELTREDLVPGGAGVRAQAVEPDGALVDDFRIQVTDRIVHVLNAPSPAATASLAIGAEVVRVLAENFSLD
jgi:L-2-hydroxyglutarate oxidase